MKKKGLTCRILSGKVASGLDSCERLKERTSLSPKARRLDNDTLRLDRVRNQRRVARRTDLTVAPIRWAMKRCKSGLIRRSFVEISIHDGFDFHAGTPTAVPKHCLATGFCAAARICIAETPGGGGNRFPNSS